MEARAGCINQLKIKRKILQPFPVLRRIFLPAIMDKSTEGRLKSIGNIMTVRRNLPDSAQRVVAEIPT